MNGKNVFRKACLVQLTTSVWMGTKMLDQGVMSKVGENSEWLRGRKFLINPELLGPLHTETHQARDLVKRYSLPFPISGLSLIPKESLSLIDERLSLRKERFLEKCEAFLGTYDLAREQARNHLGNLFNEADYPLDIRSKFRFEWRFLTLDIPGKGGILSPEVYEREKRKFEEMMEEARNQAAIALREEFGGIVTHLVERLTVNGQGKTIKSSMFNKLHEFLAELTTRNVFDDDQLVELANMARDTISGVSPYGLNYDETLRNSIKGAMTTLKGTIDESLEDLPRRKIRLNLAA